MFKSHRVVYTLLAAMAIIGLTVVGVAAASSKTVNVPSTVRIVPTPNVNFTVTAPVYGELNEGNNFTTSAVVVVTNTGTKDITVTVSANSGFTATGSCFVAVGQSVNMTISLSMVAPLSSPAYDQPFTTTFIGA